MTGLHPALLTRGAATSNALAAGELEVDEAIVALDAVAEHLQDAIDMLGHRAAGLSMGAASRRVGEVLPSLGRIARRSRRVAEPLPGEVRAARARLRDADLRLPALSREALGIVPPTCADQAELDLEMCRWVDAARLLATWIDEVGRA